MNLHIEPLSLSDLSFLFQMLLAVPQHQYPRVFPVAGGRGGLRVLAALLAGVAAPGEKLGDLGLGEHEASDHLHPQHRGHGGLRLPAQLTHRHHLGNDQSGSLFSSEYPIRELYLAFSSK